MISDRILTRINKRTIKIPYQGNTEYSVILAAIPVDIRVQKIFSAVVREKALSYLKIEIIGKIPKRGLWIYMVVI